MWPIIAVKKIAMFYCSCEIGRHVYRLSTTRSSFNGASTACGNDGGRLAVFWKESIYEELKSCCSQKGEYWIGLVDRGDCPPNAPYRRDSTTSPCRNAAPLTVAAQPNTSGCQGVVIVTAGSQRSLPMAREVQCAQSLKFICQNPLPPLTTAPTTKKSITTRSTSRTFVLPTTFETKTSIFTNIIRSSSTTSFSSTQLSLVASTFPVSFYTSPNTISNSSQSETNAAIISSIILGITILLLLLANFCYWRYKKCDSAHTKNSSATSEQPMPSLVHFKQTHTSKRNQEHLCQKYG